MGIRNIHESWSWTWSSPLILLARCRTTIYDIIILPCRCHHHHNLNLIQALGGIESSPPPPPQLPNDRPTDSSLHQPKSSTNGSEDIRLPPPLTTHSTDIQTRRSPFRSPPCDETLMWRTLDLPPLLPRVVVGGGGRTVLLRNRLFVLMRPVVAAALLELLVLHSL